jgi:hypothetical protein
MIPPGFPGALDDKKTRDLQRFDPKLAMSMLKGTPFEGGKNWPKITLTLRDEALGSKPLAEAVQAVLLENLNMKTELEVLEQRVFRERLWKQDLQFVWIRWFMDYPDPHNEYFDTFYGKKTTGKRQAWVNDAFDKELEGRARHQRPQEAPRALREGRGDHAERRRLRTGGLGRALRDREADRPRYREEQAGRARHRRQYLYRYAHAHLHGRQGLKTRRRAGVVSGAPV